jgi:tetratricopeptide (TPR) repeat protein
MNERLFEPIELQRAGRLSEAARSYESILDEFPRDANALHLLGTVSLQQGDAGRAAELIARAVAANPSPHSFHCHLGEALLKLDQPDWAIKCFRTALRLQPTCAEATNNLGLALLALGRVEEAIFQFREVVRLNGNLAIHHNNLGRALWLNRQEDEACACFRRALDLDPHLAEAHGNLGEALLNRRAFDEALEHCRQAVRLRPEVADLHNTLGNVVLAQGDVPEALSCYREALRLNPDLATTYRNIARACQRDEQLAEAVSWLEQGLERDPYAALLHVDLAGILARQGRYDDAQGRYQAALAMDPDCAEAYGGLGRLYQELSKLEEAKHCYQEALRLRPSFAAAYFNLAVVLEALGEFNSVLGCLRDCLTHDPAFVYAHYKLAHRLGAELPAEDQAALESLLPNTGSDEDRSSLHTALAYVLDAKGQYDRAAQHMRQAKELSRRVLQRRGQGYDPLRHARFLDGVRQVFSADFFARRRGAGLDTDLPVFIVGLPRSGTTLVEQVLASHSQVHGAGELSFVGDSWSSVPGLLGRQGRPLDCIGELDRAQIRLLAERHLQRLRQLSRAATRVIDKMPDNYVHLGFLATLFPRARVIHCRRDLRDVALSCWLTQLIHVSWACDIEHIAHRFHEYRRIMDHWYQVLPLPLLEVEYEELVADLEGTARHMTKWCGLEWEPTCLRFHETCRLVRTASVEQVRRPIYQHSVGRWAHYSETLAELFADLPEDGPERRSARTWRFTSG